MYIYIYIYVCVCVNTAVGNRLAACTGASAATLYTYTDVYKYMYI